MTVDGEKFQTPAAKRGWLCAPGAATPSVSDVLQHETFTIVRERSCAGPTLVRYDLKEGAVAAGFDVIGGGTRSGDRGDQKHAVALVAPLNKFLARVA